MDKAVIDQLQQAGVDTSMERHFPIVSVRLSDDGTPVPVADEVAVQSGKNVALVTLKSIPRLFTGSARPPSFANGPTEEYVDFFALIERTAVDYCGVAGWEEYDEEFERLYRQLRRRPDGIEGNRLFTYLQAAARLYMSLRDVSREEFEAVAQRLSVSARHFKTGPSSNNYLRVVGAHAP